MAINSLVYFCSLHGSIQLQMATLNLGAALFLFRMDYGRNSEAAAALVFPIRYILIPEYRYSGLQIPIPAKMCRYLPVLRTSKNGHF
jgi:hypothetical protein